MTFRRLYEPSLPQTITMCAACNAERLRLSDTTNSTTAAKVPLPMSLPKRRATAAASATLLSTQVAACRRRHSRSRHSIQPADRPVANSVTRYEEQAQAQQPAQPPQVTRRSSAQRFGLDLAQVEETRCRDKGGSENEIPQFIVYADRRWPLLIL
jgi:hypothetical protein